MFTDLQVRIKRLVSFHKPLLEYFSLPHSDLILHHAAIISFKGCQNVSFSCTIRQCPHIPHLQAKVLGLEGYTHLKESQHDPNMIPTFSFPR